MTDSANTGAEEKSRDGQNLPIHSETGLTNVLDLDQYDRLSPKQRKLARFVAENPSFVAFATASEVAQRTGTSAATVVRFAQALNFEGYNEFQQNVRHRYLGMLRSLEALQNRGKSAENIFAAQLYQDLANLRSTVENLHSDSLLEIAQQIEGARRIVILSSGTYSAPGIALAHLLQFMGYAVLLENRGGPHIAAAVAPLGSEDLLIGFSFWRVVREITEAVAWASGRGVKTVAFTDSVYSPIARAANQSVIVPSESVSYFQSMVAALSVCYALLAYLAEHLPPSRKEVMQAAEESWDILKIFYE